MKRVAFVMQLKKGCKEEYEKRHDEIWPELVQLLKNCGISDYSIFHHAQTNQLFGILKVSDETRINELKNQEVMKKWWSKMKDLMETNEDNSPKSISLVELFYLP
jgi:L-rhamnose mutarotase